MSMEEDRAKLMHLMDHWVEHNRSHEASYAEWAGRAREMGDGAVADLIIGAVERMKEADDLLLEALDELRG
jgi:hypothetical protein